MQFYVYLPSVEGVGRLQSARWFQGCDDMFDGIVRAIKGMDDEMPLALVQASPVSEMLRYTFLVCYPSSSDVCGSLSRPKRTVHAHDGDDTSI